MEKARLCESSERSCMLQSGNIPAREESDLFAFDDNVNCKTSRSSLAQHLLLVHSCYHYDREQFINGNALVVQRLRCGDIVDRCGVGLAWKAQRAEMARKMVIG